MEKHLMIPEFTTLEDMAQFWDTHDVTMFEDQLIEVQEPVFTHTQELSVISLTFDADQYQRLQAIAVQEHEPLRTLLKQWILKWLETGAVPVPPAKRKRSHHPKVSISSK